MIPHIFLSIANNASDSLSLAGGDDSRAFKIMGLKWYDSDFVDLAVKYFFDILMIFILIRLIYRSDKKNKNYAFTFYMFNTLIFFLCYMMNNVKLDIGIAFGLFAVFSILRYRTISIPLKEMTYLFVAIAVAVINSLVTKKVSFIELLFTNLVLLGTTWILEKLWYREGLSEQIVEYEKIENIKPSMHNFMLEDLKQRTGLDIREFEILTTDFLRDMARVKIYYKAGGYTGEPFISDRNYDDDDD